MLENRPYIMFRGVTRLQAQTQATIPGNLYSQISSGGVSWLFTNVQLLAKGVTYLEIDEFGARIIVPYFSS